VEEIRRSREKELEELTRVREEGRVASELLATRKAEVESLTARLRGLDEDVKGREQRVAKLRQEEDRLDSKLREYSGRGITDGTFRRLDRFSFGGEDELISRLDTAERYLGFVSETEKRGDELLNLTGRLKVLGREKVNSDAEIVKLRGVRMRSYPRTLFSRSLSESSPPSMMMDTPRMTSRVYA
jgi:DNA repair exonuclease SbcCD ATPase subunit